MDPCEAIHSNQNEKRENSEKRVTANERVTVERAPETICMEGMKVENTSWTLFEVVAGARSEAGEESELRVIVKYMFLSSPWQLNQAPMVV
jgi:hypothetical protein